MQKERFFWDYFQATGKIGAYLLYKEVRRRNNYTSEDLDLITKKVRKLG